MPDLGPLYLIHGDDHAAIAARRARLRALAESAPDGGAVELLEGPEATPAGTAMALASMTLALGRRVVIVDGVERWKAADVEEHLLAALSQIPPDTTLALFAREEQRAKVPDLLVKAVKKAGGQIRVEATVKPWELPGWTREQAAKQGLQLDNLASKALVAQVGERPQRILRELEKLALAVQAPASGSAAPRSLGAEEIQELAAHSVERRGYALADALLEGDRQGALALLLSLRAQGEALPGLLYAMARRMRDGVSVAQRLAVGEPPAEIKSSLRPMPPRAAERFIAAVRRTDIARLQEALVVLADLELDSRGGPVLPSQRRPRNGLGEDTLAVRAVEAITA
jgi:DNA polymerase III subunit delta